MNGAAIKVLILLPLALLFAGPALAADAPAPDAPSQPPAAPAPPAPPNPSTPAPAAPAAPAPVASVPLKLMDDKACVDVMIDGQGPFTLAIDSGAETMVVNQAVADKCKLALKTGTVEVRGTTGGFVPVLQAEVGEVKIGAATVASPFCTVGEVRSCDGIIGAPLMNAYTVQIDFPGKTVNFYAPDTYQPSPADIPVPIPFGKQRVPVLSGMVGSLPASMEIDTGSAFPVELLPGFVNEHDLTHKFPRIGSVGQSSVSGPIQTGVYDAGSIVIGTSGKLAAHGVIPTLLIDTAGAARPGEIDGRLGEPILTGFVLTFDYKNAQIYFRPLPAAPAQATQ